jgi:hypothetical protein
VYTRGTLVESECFLDNQNISRTVSFEQSGSRWILECFQTLIGVISVRVLLLGTSMV